MHQTSIAVAGISRLLDPFPYNENITCQADAGGEIQPTQRSLHKSAGTPDPHVWCVWHRVGVRKALTSVNDLSSAG